MLTLTQQIALELLAHAEDEHPLECCGLLIQAEDGRLQRISMRNQAQARDFFQFDATQQLQIWREIDARDQHIVAIYHSHTAAAAYPSKADINYAALYPEILQLIVSSDPQFSPRLRCFQIQPDQVRELALQIVNEQSY